MLKLETFAGPRAFARWALRDNRLALRPALDSIMCFRDSGIESILFRESCWQIELVVAMPNAGAEMHKHLRCSSADVLMNGHVLGSVEGRGISSSLRGPLAAQLKTIGRGEVHGGAVGPQGLVYVSFQQWFDGDPTFISQDWAPA